MKETFSGAELGSRTTADGSPGRCRSSALSHDELRCVARLRDEARKYGLLGADVLDAMTEEQMVQDLVDRFINKVGTVKLTTSDVTDPVLELRGLENFDAAFKTINEQRKLFTRRRGVMSFGTSPVEDQNR